MLTVFARDTGHATRLTGPADRDVLHRAIWIDLQEPTEAEAASVVQATGSRLPTLAEVSEIESSSRHAVRDGVLYLNMPMVTVTDMARIVPAGFVLSPERLVTVRFAPSKVFDAFSANCPTGGAAHILTGLLEAITDRQADALEKVQSDMEAISHRIFRDGNNGGRKIEDRMLRATLREIGRIGDLMSHIRDSQLGAARLLPFIETHAMDWLPPELRPRLETLRQDIASVSDFGTHLSDKLQFLLDATLGFISTAQNDVMKVMTIASVVGIPPVMVVGLYGMNFKNIHEYDWAYGYQYAWALIVATTIVPLLIFRWRKWI